MRLAFFLLSACLVATPALCQCAPRPELDCAAEDGDLEKVRALLAAGNSPTDREIQPLVWAMKSGNIEVVRLLLDHGGDPNGNEELTPLFMAIEDGWVEGVRLLLDRGADPNGIGDFDPLSEAAGNELPRFVTLEERLEIARLLLRKGAAPHRAEGEPMRSAILSGDLAMVELLHDAGAPFETVNGLSPLVQATHAGSSDIVRFLLDRHLAGGEADIRDALKAYAEELDSALNYQSRGFDEQKQLAALAVIQSLLQARLQAGSR